MWQLALAWTGGASLAHGDEGHSGMLGEQRSKTSPTKSTRVGCSPGGQLRGLLDLGCLLPLHTVQVLKG